MGFRVSKILNEKFGAKVFVYFSLLFTIASFLFISMFYHHQSRSMQDKLINTGEMLLEIFNQNAAPYVFSETSTLLEQQMQLIRNLNDVLNISVYNRKGERIKSLTNPYELEKNPTWTAQQKLSSLSIDKMSQTTFFFEERQACYLFYSPITMGASYALISSGTISSLKPPSTMGERYHPDNSEVDSHFDIPEEPAGTKEKPTTTETGNDSNAKTVSPDTLEQNTIGFTIISISTNQLKKQIQQLLRYIFLVGFIFVFTGSLIIFLMMRSITTPLNRLTQSVKTLETRKAGTRLKRVPVETDDEIGKLATAINHMSDTIQRREEALTNSEKRLRILSTRLIDIRDCERKNLSRDLHDDLNQTLANLKMKVRRIGRQTNPDGPAITKQSDEAALEVDRIIDSVRRISKDLSPSLLDDLGLSSGLRWLLNNFEKQHGISVVSVVNDIDSLFAKDARINIFRLFQEALSNISKHSGAENISVVIKREPQYVTFIISDDGVGFDANSTMALDAEDIGIGLINMNERARKLGADLEIESNEGEGTFITFKVATSNSKENNQWTLTA